ncbi:MULTISPECIES: hypothetical protein [unclassified Sphingomonas]|uniref:hypothetical protein n=1 Tax=unclassified Sphingomonas TaxID=196159 RepID=UPI00226ABC9F|nr:MULTISPECIES: hypothetical protein [unclassified Sphingomonas]
MYLTHIDGEGAADLLTGVQKDLTDLAAGLDARFLRAGTTLATAVTAIGRVIDALDDVTKALDERAAGAAVRDLGDVAERLAALPIAQAERTADLATVSAMTKSLREQVVDMHHALQVLRIYGVNIKIAASGADQFVVFVDGMTRTLGVGEQELDAFQLVLKGLTAAVAAAHQAERLLAAECGKVAPDVPRKLAGDAAELHAHLETVAEAARRVSVIARDIQGRVATILGALQVGDSTRQRLEHVVAALQMLDARPATGDGAAEHAVVAHVYRMLDAQLAAIATDFDREASLLVGSLGELAPDTARLLSLIENGNADEGRNFLQRLEHGIGDVERLTSQLHEADRRSHVMVGAITEAVDALAARSDRIRRIRLDVQDIAINTRLMCRRFGDVGKAVAVIASEVDVYANRLGTALDGVMGPIHELTQVGVSMKAAQGGPERIDGSQALSEALSTIGDGCRRTERGVSRGSDDANEVIAIIDQTSAELADELALSDAIRQAGSSLALAAGDDTALPDRADAVLRDLLPRIADLYTMAQERGVHDEFLLAGMSPVGSVSSDDGLFDEDDDGLF